MLRPKALLPTVFVITWAGAATRSISTTKICCTRAILSKWAGVNSPKATVSFLPKESWFVPLLSLSFGEAFFTETLGLVWNGSGGTGTRWPGRILTSLSLAEAFAIQISDLRSAMSQIVRSWQKSIPIRSSDRSRSEPNAIYDDCAASQLQPRFAAGDFLEGGCTRPRLRSADSRSAATIFDLLGQLRSFLSGCR